MLRVRYLKGWPALWAGLLLLGTTLPAQAHNGAVAIAVPVEGIKIDGDLSDWPVGMRRYPIALPVFGVKPRNAEDFQGFFRIGYSAQENALYLAVEVQDESTVIDTTYAWDSQDGCVVYVDAAHDLMDSSTAQYRIGGNKKKVPAEVDVEVQRKEQAHRYEWRLDLGRMSQGPVRLHPEMTLGVDVVAIDKDQDGSFSWVSWGKGTAKITSEGRLGDVVLVDSEARTGKLRGRMQWEKGGDGVNRGKVSVQCATSEALLVQAETDEQGDYAVELPVGRYRVEAVGRAGPAGQGDAVEVMAGKEVQVDMVKPLPRGMTVPAGKGQTVSAGAGNRQGVWLTLDASDGLSSPTVLAVYRDREECLWFGMQGGVTRYDGVSFTSFTVRDGLAGISVTSIQEDREGHLWFGTKDGGVSRFDGTHFTTFTAEDGLADNFVSCILEDRQGRLWFGGNEGVSCFDGAHIATFNREDGLASNGVTAILEDRQGHLWFGTFDGGVSRYDGAHFTSFNTEDGLANNNVRSIGEDRAGNLWFGTWGGGVSRYDGKRFTNFTTRDGLGNNAVFAITLDREGHLWFGFGPWGGGVSRYDGVHFTTFGTAEGLASEDVRSIGEDREGHLWFGTFGGGVSRYDGADFTTFTTRDGLPSNGALSILEDRKGYLWFGTFGGVSRYDGASFTTFTTREGLVHDNVGSILEDRQGHLWFGTFGGGVSRYDGKRFTNFTTRDGLASNDVNCILEDRQGYLWFATDAGVSRFDGTHFTTFGTGDGLAGIGHGVTTILEDQEGHLWFGTYGGVSRYDGKQFTSLSTQGGLAGNLVRSILEDRQGYLWFGTEGGVSRYDGKQFTNFNAKGSLPGNRVWCIFQDRQEYLWFGFADGVSRFDGVVFQRLLSRDGLGGNEVRSVLQDSHGDIWIATDKGVTRCRSHPTPPPVHMVNVSTDRAYGPVNAIDLPSSQHLLVFEFQGISAKTRPGQIVYLYRLDGYDQEWRQTRDTRVEYPDLPVGRYTFEVKAVDRDLSYSEAPATVKVTIHPPYGQIALVGGLGVALVMAVVASGYGIRRRRERDQAREALMREMAEELQTAHTLQMGLMPREAPQLPGFDLAGRCLPANHVGGDLFQYFHQDGKLSIALADVTGHAMEAAIPMVMFSGILKSQMENSGPIEELFGRLNRSLHNAAGSRTFVCFAFGTIDTRTSTLHLSSAAFPYPYHFSAATGEIAELQIDAYPLGVRPDTRYAAIERQLAPGDYLVFCSDGIIEATDVAGAQFGYERTAETIRRGCQEDLSPEGLLERLMGEVKGFRGEMPQGDDQTVVVVKVEEQKSA